MAALAVHVPAEDWGDGGIVTWIRDEMGSHHEFIPSFLELLRVLPEVYGNQFFRTFSFFFTVLLSLSHHHRHLFWAELELDFLVLA